jgi:hypothetical protein
MENFEGSDPPIHLLPNSPFPLKLSQYFKTESDQRIEHKDLKVPDSNYKWALEGEGSISQGGRFVAGEKPGQVEVSVVE